MNPKLKGVVYGILAAISYGTNPLGALFLYREGVNTNSVLFYRFTIAALILGTLMFVKKQSFRITLKELSLFAVLGVLFGISALSLFSSFHYMDAGIASTILFVYPVMVAVIMAVFFKEKISFITLVSIALALSGIGLLYQGENGTTLSTIGVILVMVSSLTYALYIIIVNQSSLLNVSTVKLTFYVLLFCILTIVIHSFSKTENNLQLLTTPSMWMWAIMLALIPTIISLIMMAKSVHIIGSTPTAILGALEPLTAVVIGVTAFNEAFTMKLGMGILMILFAVCFIIYGKTLNHSKIMVVVHRVEHNLKKRLKVK